MPKIRQFHDPIDFLGTRQSQENDIMYRNIAIFLIFWNTRNQNIAMLKASCFPLPLFRECKTLNITASILDLEKETDRSKCLSFFKFYSDETNHLILTCSNKIENQENFWVKYLRSCICVFFFTSCKISFYSIETKVQFP